MKHPYSDIRSRITEEPQWWDEYGVPRYCEFEPDETAVLGPHEVMLAEIECQQCGQHFQVAIAQSLCAEIQHGRFAQNMEMVGYGDPPNAGCCPAGPTMSSYTVRIIQFWQRDESTNYQWLRQPGFEIEINERDRFEGDAPVYLVVEKENTPPTDI